MDQGQKDIIKYGVFKILPSIKMIIFSVLMFGDMDKNMVLEKQFHKDMFLVGLCIR